MKLNKLIAILFILCSYNTIVFSQTKFNEGFTEGYKKGYCQDKGVGCISPVPPVAPVPQPSENFNSYQDGYNRGFTQGLNDGKSNNNTSVNRQRYQTSSFEPIDYMYKGSNELTSLKIQLYNKLFPEMIEDFNNSRFQDVITKGNSLLKVDLGTQGVYELIGASYCNLNEGNQAKYYLKKAIKQGSQNAKNIYGECIKDDTESQRQTQRISVASFFNLGYNKLVNDNFKSNLKLKGGWYGDIGLNVYYDVKENYSLGLGLSFLQSLWWYDYYNVSNIQTVNLLRLHASNIYFLDKVKRNYILGGLNFGKAISAKNTNSNTTNNIDYFSNVHTSFNFGIGSRFKFKKGFILITPNIEYQLNNHFDNNSSQAKIFRFGIDLKGQHYF